MVRTAGQLSDVAMRGKRGADLVFHLVLVVSVPLLLAASLSCAAPGTMPPTYGFVEPPRAELKASLAQEPIKTSDVLQVKLPDGSTASVTQTFLVAPDGTIEVSGRGKVQVAGKTLQQAQEAIQAAAAVSDAAEQAIELAMSECYLVTVDTNGLKQLKRVPIKGQLRVSDVLAHMKASDKIIWVVRPDPSRYLTEQTLPVDWESVSRDPHSRTNYELRPGDWLMVADEPARGMARVFDAFTGMAGAPQADTSHAH